MLALAARLAESALRLHGARHCRPVHRGRLRRPPPGPVRQARTPGWPRGCPRGGGCLSRRSVGVRRTEVRRWAGAVC